MNERIFKAVGARRAALVLSYGIGGPIALVSMALFFYSLNAIPTVVQWYILVPILLIFAAAFTLGLVFTIREEWFGSQFVLSAEGITKIFPSGKRQSGKWDELTSLQFSNNVLVFSCGTRITICPMTWFYHPILLAIHEVRPDLELFRSLVERIREVDDAKRSGRRRK